jgi:NitT/TauT family transport system ATP-binding protein
MLSVRDLSLGYGGEPAVSDCDLDVRGGEFASLVGPSGSGKSSLLRAIAGLHPPDGGTVDLGVGLDKVGFLFQDDALLPWRTVRYNAALGMLIRGTPRREAYQQAEVWLARLGVGPLAGRFPSQLSGGQRKRVALAQVLALEPRLLLMDEPFAALDAIMRHRVTEDLLRWVDREEITVLLVTHDLEEAITLSDRVHLLTQGPYARIHDVYEVPLDRPRNLVGARSDPAFGPLLRRMWDDLAAVSDEALAERRQEETLPWT